MPSEDQIRIDTPEQIQLEFPLAGIGSRFLALALDTVIQVLLYIAGTFALIAGAGLLKNLPNYFAWIPENWAAALVILFLFSVYWGYFAFFEIIWKGQTPGKRLTGIRVIKDSGRPINVYEAIGRNLMRVVDWLPGMYITGVVSMMISRQNRRLGDHVVGSVVVHDKRPEQIRPDWSSAHSATQSNPAISKITPDELVLIETYLQRRLDLDPSTRDTTAYKIATRITAKTGIERAPDQSLDDFLEEIAKQVRDTARFR
ncbi:MAG: RDD family protein [Terriglobales bacterium]